MTDVWTRAGAVAQEVKDLRSRAHQAGEEDLGRELKNMDRANNIPAHTETIKSLDLLRARLTEQIAAAMRPQLEQTIREEVQDLYLDRNHALDQWEAELESRPQARYPWIAVGTVIGVWGSLIIGYIA